MIKSYNEIRYTWKTNRGIPDFRTAAFVLGLNKIANSDVALGKFH